MCLLEGAQLAFDVPVKYVDGNGVAQSKQDVNVTFVRVQKTHEHAHHDAIQFSDGLIVKLKFLLEGQQAQVLQLSPAALAIAQEQASTREIVYA